MTRLKIGTKELKTPRTVRNIDETDNKEETLKQYTDLEIKFNGRTHIQQFYITNLGEDRTIFEFPWMQTFESEINWEKAEIAGRATVRTTKKGPLMHSPHIACIILSARQIAAKIQLPVGEEIHYALNKMNVAQQWAEAQYKQEKREQSKIPTPYKDFKDVFS